MAVYDQESIYWTLKGFSMSYMECFPRSKPYKPLGNFRKYWFFLLLFWPFFDFQKFPCWHTWRLRNRFNLITGEVRGWEGAKSYDGGKAGSSMNLWILSDSTPWFTMIFLRYVMTTCICHPLPDFFQDFNVQATEIKAAKTANSRPNPHRSRFRNSKWQEY